MTDDAAFVRMNGLSKTYPNGTVALSDVNLTISEGEFISFVGPSGCGKSTIFKLITGLSGHTSGELTVLGKTPKEARKANNTSFVFQDHTLLPWSSVIDNVMLPLSLRGDSKKESRKEAERVLEMVGLRDYTKALPRMLSGGMKMRVSIARALVSKPKLLLMDEPFAALDEITRQTLQDELLSIWQQEKRMTVLFVTHNVFESVFLSSRVAVMTPRPGRISEIIDIDVPYPRSQDYRSTAKFGELVRSVSNVLQH
ncbi:ABC transporter ATP-binding protein [Paenibacillus sp. HB172176]|uniref:ABC transporter ATP-binding protein n=1 Tax=Paenibacillus sp. HB172176 TaxID=2493690 RepID=UPI001F0F9525|nr:ABC transporter ATP-binding protein [Paenibacillus sp. HB172176]